MSSSSIYYYILLFASFLFIFAFIPFVFEINQQRITSNIPYLTLFLLLISFLLYLFVSISKGYFVHFFLYLIGIISISILFFLKRKYDIKKT